MDIIRKEVSDCLHLLFCIAIEDWYLMTLSAPKFGATFIFYRLTSIDLQFFFSWKVFGFENLKCANV